MLLPVVLMAAVSAPMSADDVWLEEVENALADVSWLTVHEVRLDTPADDDTELIVYYVTRETDMLAYRAEMLEVFRVLGALDMPNEDMTLSIAPMVDMGDGIEAIEAGGMLASVVRDFANGDLTRTAFLDDLTFTPLEHQSRSSSDPA